MATDTDLVMYRGDDRSFLVTLTGLDVSSAEVTFTAKRSVADADDEAVITLATPTDVQVVSATQIRVNIPASATLPLTGQVKLVWDLQIELSGDIRTVPEASTSRTTLGTLLVRQDVTRAPA